MPNTFGTISNPLLVRISVILTSFDFFCFHWNRRSCCKNRTRKIFRKDTAKHCVNIVYKYSCSIIQRAYNEYNKAITSGDKNAQKLKEAITAGSVSDGTEAYKYATELASKYNITVGAYQYREEIKQFLNDGRPKILKLADGRTWMIMIIDSLDEDNGSIEGYVHTSFSWVEIGNPESSSDLYENNFIDVNLEG